jgi:hypothetical protein
LAASAKDRFLLEAKSASLIGLPSTLRFLHNQSTKMWSAGRRAQVLSQRRRMQQSDTIRELWSQAAF